MFFCISFNIFLLFFSNPSFSLQYTVEQLKEHIADTIQIPSESQRCIYLGQVLQNDAKLADCGKFCFYLNKTN